MEVEPEEIRKSVKKRWRYDRMNVLIEYNVKRFDRYRKIEDRVIETLALNVKFLSINRNVNVKRSYIYVYHKISNLSSILRINFSFHLFIGSRTYIV